MAERRKKLRQSKRVADGTQHLTPDYVHRALERMHKRYQDRNAMIRSMRKMRFMEDKDPNEVPENYREGNPAIRTYLAGRWVENEVGALTTLPPRFHVPLPPNSTIEDRERAEHIERFLPAFWERSERERGRGTYRQLFDNSVADGVGVLKGLYKPSVWQTMPGAKTFAKGATPEMRESEALREMSDDEADGYDKAITRYIQKTSMPIAFCTVDPLTVYAIRGEFGIDCVIEESRRSMIAVRRLAGPFGGVPLSADDPDDSDMVRVVEYWDEEYMAVYAELMPSSSQHGTLDAAGGLVLIGTMEHKLGRIPYWFVHGQETSSTDPRYEAISTLFKVKDAVPAFHRVLNQYLTITKNKAQPTFQQKRAPGGPTDAASEPLKIKAKPGDIVYVDDSIEDPFIRPIEWPAQEINLPVVLNMLLALGEQTQMSSAATGGSNSSGESGYLRAQLVDLARTGYHQIIAHGERAISGASEWALEMIDTRLKRELYVRGNAKEGRRKEWLAVGPEILQGDYAVDVRIIPFNPIMDIARGTFGANMILQGVYPRGFAYENIMGVEDPQALKDELLLDKMEESPPVQQALMLRGAREAGLTELAGAAAPVTPAEAQVMAAMGGSMGGRPTGNPSTPGAGMPTANPANSGQAVPIGPAGG